MEYINREDAIMEIIEKACNALSEYCDAVQIHASFDKGNDMGTSCLHKGCGNDFARMGMAQDFINRDNARIHLQIQEEEFDN